MATSGHPSRLAAAATPSPPFSSSFSNSSSTNQEELSAACYIRSLVKKHLMSSSSSSPARSSLHEDHHLNTMANTTVPHDRHHRPQPQPEQEQAAEHPPVAVRPQVKKQARKRTHASRPYQERLLNMAEARREIVTALKIHRANMRHQQPCTYQLQVDKLSPLRQSPLQQLRRQEQLRQEVQVVFQDRSQQAVEEEGALLAAPASYASYSDHQLRHPSPHWISASAAAPPAGSCFSSPILPYDLTPPLEVPMPTAMGGLEQLALSLPAQPLGLNLSFVQGFGGSAVDGARDCEGLFVGVPVIQSTSSPAASSYSASYSSPATEMASGTYGSPVLCSTAEKYSSSIVDALAPLIAPVLDDGVGDTQSAAGEAHGVEWWGEGEATAADVAVASAWWSKALLETMESGGGGEVVEGGSAVGCTPEDVAATSAGLPPADQWQWLCDDGVGEQGAVTGTDDKPPDLIEMLADGEFYACCYDEGDRRRSDGGDGITLPCMDGIGDIIEGSDVEWFSRS